jgi:hypothetical protein
MKAKDGEMGLGPPLGALFAELQREVSCLVRRVDQSQELGRLSRLPRQHGAEIEKVSFAFHAKVLGERNVGLDDNFQLARAHGDVAQHEGFLDLKRWVSWVVSDNACAKILGAISIGFSCITSDLFSSNVRKLENPNKKTSIPSFFEAYNRNTRYFPYFDLIPSVIFFWVVSGLR